ncbi:MAG: hypothetical protein KA117_04410 [Verrucomicrobia bacterium]|nr:hypothetical protein [Verrucomicrobiota bacterium]OQC26746.1 MAG: hypothetical protein BWX68_00491 [Verrucomicrobia bacterium ADurb.Bin063]MBP8014523.1 hypothetical protein [Verrucomicrobiota bacterium]HNW06992.1 hypothetical protein [Verrucomicrobiota bacterium]HNZ75044.1 hypothetical protein [Verrucomicrobiota bacterium]
MIRDILQSDVAFARRLLNENPAEAEIVQALIRRGLDPDKAAQLVSDLRDGRPVSYDANASLEFTPRRRSRSRSNAAGTANGPSGSSTESAPRRKPSAPPAARPGRRRFPWKLFIALLALALALQAIVIAILVRQQKDPFSPPRSETAAATPRDNSPRPVPPGEAGGAAPGNTAAPVLLELQPDGLYLGGERVSRENLLPAVARQLGAPSRTNRVAQTGAIIYVFDRHGLLLYAQPDGGPTSIVLDCEGTGGNAGATTPFAGRLKVENTEISPDTDSLSLAAIQKLPLTRRGRTSNILTGHYGKFELIFGYVRSNQRLSLVEINLK